MEPGLGLGDSQIAPTEITINRLMARNTWLVASITAWLCTRLSIMPTAWSGLKPLCCTLLLPRSPPFSRLEKAVRPMVVELFQAVVVIEVAKAPAVVRTKLSKPAPPASSLGDRVAMARLMIGMKKNGMAGPR